MCLSWLSQFWFIFINQSLSGAAAVLCSRIIVCLKKNVNAAQLLWNQHVNSLSCHLGFLSLCLSLCPLCLTLSLSFSFLFHSFFFLSIRQHMAGRELARYWVCSLCLWSNVIWDEHSVFIHLVILRRRSLCLECCGCAPLFVRLTMCVIKASSSGNEQCVYTVDILRARFRNWGVMK